MSRRTAADYFSHLLKRTCSSCGQIKCLHTEFPRSAKGRRGYGSQCKACRNAQARARRARKRGEEPAEEGMRHCSQCGEAKPLDDFRPRGRVCSECRDEKRRASRRKWAAENSEALKRSRAAYRRRARCIQLLRRIEENSKLIAEYEKNPSLMLVCPMDVIRAPEQHKADTDELTKYSAKEIEAAEAWAARDEGGPSERQGQPRQRSTSCPLASLLVPEPDGLEADEPEPASSTEFYISPLRPY